MKTQSNFLVAMLSDEHGNPSSKRVSGFMILLYTMALTWIKSDIQIEFLATWLGAALVSLGISGVEKIANNIRKPQDAITLNHDKATKQTQDQDGGRPD
jgi:hypothetical protein